MNEIECAWVAGLLEGEGSFTLGPFGNRTRSSAVRQLRITCAMTDLDTIEKLHRIVGIGGVNPEARRDPRRDYAKPLYIWQATKRADVIALLNEIRPHMGARRGAKIDELLQYAAENPPIYNRPVTCGTKRAYRKGCRCDDCRGAMSAYARDLRERKRSGEFTPKARENYAAPV